MRKLLSIAVAAAFAAASFGTAAQQDVKTKTGGAVADKKGTNVETKAPKEAQKPAPKMKKKAAAAAAPKAKEMGSDVKTKSGGAVANKKGDDVTTKTK
ncbi:MAG TPA: hypothetical protein VKS43_14265 [Burkholderiales bacterium]|nr:hypothetical protein [Burkholderiales bacterium]